MVDLDLLPVVVPCTVAMSSSVSVPSAESGAANPPLSSAIAIILENATQLLKNLKGKTTLANRQFVDLAEKNKD